MLHLLFCIYTLLAYALCYWPVSSHWISGFVMMSLPVAVAVHLLVFSLGLLLGARKMALNSLFMALISFPFWQRTFRFGNSDGPSGEKDFRVLSYNIHKLGVRVKTGSEISLLSDEGIAWLKETDADIVCFQEIYHQSNSRTDLVQAMKKIGYGNFAVVNHRINEKPKMQAGLAIFSKYRLRNLEEKEFGYQNGLLKADVLVGSDTLTLVNAHLQSMTLDLRELVEQREVDGIKSESRKTFSLIKKGFQRRSRQGVILEEWVEKSGHPVVVCGDFNETPYSYVYGRLSKLLDNSFEEGGSGFGFTFRNLPYFIRIDNQFFSPGKIDLNRFETVKAARFSDHRPIVGDYTFKR